MRATSLLAWLGFPALGLLSLASAIEADGKAGRTGAPGEMTCRQGCHSSFQLNSGGGSIVLNAPSMNNWEYVPGNSYPMSVTVSQTGVGLFGFALGALTDNGTNAGTLVITDPSRTHIKTAFVGSVERNNVTHRALGGLDADASTFDFVWTAPDVNVGPVSFHFAGNAANQDWTPDGDYIYTGSQVATPASSVNIADAELEDNTSTPWVTTEGTGGETMVHFRTRESGTVLADVLDARGRNMGRVFMEELPPGVHHKHLNDLSKLRSGTYFLHLHADGRDQAVRFVHAAR